MFGILDGIKFVGGLMALVSGISVISVIQLVSNSFCWFKNDKNTSSIPRAEMQNRFACFTFKLYHLRKDLQDFVRMSSIHGVRQLKGTKGKKFFWLTVISVLTAVCVYFVRELLEAFPQNRVVIEIVERSPSENEVY